MLLRNDIERVQGKGFGRGGVHDFFGFRGLALPRRRSRSGCALLLDCNRLARAQPHREFELLAKILGRVFHQHVRFVVIADLEYLRRYFGTSGIAFAGVAIHYDFHDSLDRDLIRA
jgi:hypothetical protein